jgi:hypothetical protein
MVQIAKEVAEISTTRFFDAIFSADQFITG